MLIELTALSAPDDPRLADYISMTDVNLRKSLEVERGLYMAESTNVIIRALEAGHRPRSLMMAPVGKSGPGKNSMSFSTLAVG